MLAALGLAGCGGSSGTITVKGAEAQGELRPATGVSVESLRLAAARTSSETSGGFEMVMSVGGGGSDGVLAGSMTMTMSGVYTGTQSQMSMRTDMAGLEELPEGLGEMASMLDMEMITDGDVGYVRGGMFSMFGGQDPDVWVRMPVEEVAAQSMASPLGDDGVTDLLSGAYGEVAEVGAEDVRGVGTTRYRVLLDPEQVASNPLMSDAGAELRALDEVPMDVWVDGDGFVRRMAVELAGSDAPSMTLRMEFFDLGDPVAIEVPADAVDFDESAFADSMFEQMEGILGGEAPLNGGD